MPRPWLTWFLLLLLPARWRHEPLIKFCTCGTLIWHVQVPSQLSSYLATTICPGCGQDYSRVPTVWWAARFYWRRLRKRARYFGLFGMWRATYPAPFWEIRPKAARVSKASERIVVWPTTTGQEEVNSIAQRSGAGRGVAE